MLPKTRRSDFTDARLSTPSEGLPMHVRHGPPVPVRRTGAAFVVERKRDAPTATNWCRKCRRLALTDAEIEAAALYRTLRQLEKNGCVLSEWDTEHSGPARRVYAADAAGDEHLGGMG